MPDEVPPRRRPWALDNGAYRTWQAGLANPFADFEGALAHAGTAEFVVAPDLPAEGEASLELSLEWLPLLRGLPVYLAAQDGMSELAIERALREGFAGLFVGGTVPWKVAMGEKLVGLAHRAGKPCHLGRCGTPTRIKWAHRIGADSIDSCGPIWTQYKLGRAVGALEIARRQLALEL